MVERKGSGGRSRRRDRGARVAGAPLQSTTFEVMRKGGMNMSWSLASRLKLALAAVEFYDVEKRSQMARFLPDSRPHARGSGPFTLLDFALYLEAREIFPKKPNHFRVQQIVGRLASEGVLVQAGYFGDVPALFGERYLCFRGMFGTHLRGNLWLAPVLGPELLYTEAGPGVVHITGTRDGQAVGGSGVVVHANYIATCRHVVETVVLDREQHFQGRKHVVEPTSVHIHATEDIALIRVDGEVKPLHGAVFRKPIVGQEVYTMGYPRLPNTQDATLTMQGGAVTNERVKSLGGEALFLYSAISRPGNSGGPVFSADGFVVGMAVEDHVASYHGEESLFAPHYAGVPAEVVVEAIEELAPDIQLVVEHLE